MAKDYTVRDATLEAVHKMLKSVMAVDGVDSFTAWPKVLRMERKKHWELNALLRHAVAGRCGGNANVALDDLWTKLGDTAYHAFAMELQAGRFDRHGNEKKAPTANDDMQMLMHIGRIDF